jgi:ABC-2 type transport system permease protein
MVRVLRASRAEWTKVRTLQSTAWLLLGAVVATVAVGFTVTASLDYSHCDAPCVTDTGKLSLAGVRLGQVAVVIFAVLGVTAEYATRTIQPTLAAFPRRTAVVIGKLVTHVALAVLVGAAAAVGSVVAARAALPHTGFPQLSLSDHLLQRAALGTTVYMGLIAALGVGLGLLLRDTAGALIVALAMMYGMSVVAGLISDPRWEHRLHRYSPMDAGLAIQSTRNVAAEHIGPWAGIGVLAAYAGAVLAAGFVTFLVRDAR